MAENDANVAEPIDVPLVAESESEILMMARALLQPARYDAWSVMCRTKKLPPKIGETCRFVLEETLAQTWPCLWRRGGTQPRPGQDGKRARGWERTAPQRLAFSPVTMSLLRWLVGTSLGAPSGTPLGTPLGPPLSTPASTLDCLSNEKMLIGDQVLIYLALDMAASTPAAATIAKQPLVRACPLARLGFAHLFDKAPGEGLDFDSLTAGAGATVIEALSDEIARRWHQIELSKRSYTSPEALTSLGVAQDGTLTRWMTTCDKRGRRDLAQFILDAATPTLSRRVPPLPVQLDPTTTLSARMTARVAAGSLLRAVVKWHDWNTEHRGVRFIDDNYNSVQAMLGRFERLGSAGADLAVAWLAELASLAPAPISILTGDKP